MYLRLCHIYEHGTMVHSRQLIQHDNEATLENKIIIGASQ